jgi:hypothetical protein
MQKVVVALLALAAIIGGCSAKADEGDANVKVTPGTAKAPTAPTGAGGGGPAGGPGAAQSATPQVPGK